MNIRHLFRKPVIQQPTHLYIGDSLIHGRGVFSNKKLLVGDLVEKAPLVLVNNRENELLKQTILYHYYFLLEDKEYPVAIGLGYSSFYNHACPSNAGYHIDLGRKLIEIKAVRPIVPGEEITINYNGATKDASPVFFPDQNL